MGLVRVRLLLVLIVMLLSSVLGLARAEDNSVMMLAAVTTENAAGELSAAFTKSTGIQVKVIAGTSHGLTRQILADAPADLFLAVSNDWVETLKRKDYVADVHPLLTSDLVMIVPSGNPAKVKTPEDLTSSAVGKVAIGCDHGPCGKYAQQALTAAGVFNKLSDQDKFAQGMDVRVSLSFVERREADAGVVFSTDALISKKVEVVYQFDHKTYDPVVYPLVLLKAGAKKSAATKFHEYLLSEPARQVFIKYGFAWIAATPKKDSK